MLEKNFKKIWKKFGKKNLKKKCWKKNFLKIWKKKLQNKNIHNQNLISATLFWSC